VDIVAAGCSKGTGVDKVRELFGIDRFGGIGDSYNDLPLLQASDISFTFPDAPDELREAADEIVRSVSEAIGKMR
jgi:hydroxymethylpyrimidine pyrophosphatase-like HAD family hydrolase